MRRSIRKPPYRHRHIAQNRGRGKRGQPGQKDSILRGFKALRRTRDAFSPGIEN
jgi:hypothetical protein